ncbi:glucan biosynthesis protein [Piscinibacterium candidicorallinum]|uniref:Glucans biosynthesis protein G n=1 Tax=Piscinibacterium candidicorallinum TaxID=1793872 RepID=A0ABV7H9Q9_9BURK
MDRTWSPLVVCISLLGHWLRGVRRAARVLTLAGLGGLAVPLAAWAQATAAASTPAQRAFGFDDVAREARALAAQPWRAAPPADPRRAALDYDAVRRIQFRAEASLWRGTGSPFEMQFFPVAGAAAVRELRLFEIEQGQARALRLPARVFNNDGVLPPEPPDATAPVAGWRLTYPLNEGAKQDEVVAFVGSNYFRALGQGQRYGLSARGIAIDTTGGAPEEFPDFTTFWFERPAAGSKQFVFYALLDGPRVAGAYQFTLQPGAATVTTVRAQLFLRAGSSPIRTLGIAPLTSMFLHGENQASSTGDFRPEVHDSDGLQIETAAGEWLWRPLTNPAGVLVTSFALNSPRGFGLMQRDRSFASYEDIEARYEARPSAWVEPIGQWGEGRVELLQFRTPDETHDNIAAFWVPAQLPAPGQSIDLAWRIHWQGPAPGGADRSPPGARVLQTRSGYGYFKGERPAGLHKLVIDFSDTPLPAGVLAQDVQARASLGANTKLRRVHTYPNPVRGGWRSTLEFERLDASQPVELRLYLQAAAGAATHALSETWSYVLPPQ